MDNHFSHGILVSNVEFIASKVQLPVLTDIFMVELQNTLVASLTEYLKLWKTHVDDTISFVKTASVECIVSILMRTVSSLTKWRTFF